MPTPADRCPLATSSMTRPYEYHVHCPGRLPWKAFWVVAQGEELDDEVIWLAGKAVLMGLGGLDTEPLMAPWIVRSALRALPL